MKYIYVGGPYREFRGYVFANGNPVTVTDRGTLEAIEKEPDFMPVVEPQVIPDDPEKTLPPVKGKECSKCGKIIPRGWYMHQRWCKGK